MTNSIHRRDAKDAEIFFQKIIKPLRSLRLSGEYISVSRHSRQTMGKTVAEKIFDAHDVDNPCDDIFVLII